MSLHKKLIQICNDRDLSSYLDMLHDDFTVVFHKSGNSFSKEEWSSMVAGMFENEKFVFESSAYMKTVKLWLTTALCLIQTELEKLLC